MASAIWHYYDTMSWYTIISLIYLILQWYNFCLPQVLPTLMVGSTCIVTGTQSQEQLLSQWCSLKELRKSWPPLPPGKSNHKWYLASDAKEKKNNKSTEVSVLLWWPVLIEINTQYVSMNCVYNCAFIESERHRFFTLWYFIINILMR